MPRITCIVAGAAAAAIAAAAGDAFAASRKEHRHASPHHTSRPITVAAPPVRTIVVYSAVAAYAPTYRPSSYGTSRQPPTSSRTATPPVYFVPAISPNAPPFSFSESVAQPGWNWQRVSLQQVDAEIRARRLARDPAKALLHRYYCPDSRAYRPEATQCASEWLIVVGRAPTDSPASHD